MKKNPNQKASPKNWVDPSLLKRQKEKAVNFGNNCNNYRDTFSPNFSAVVEQVPTIAAFENSYQAIPVKLTTLPTDVASKLTSKTAQKFATVRYHGNMGVIIGKYDELSIVMRDTLGITRTVFRDSCQLIFSPPKTLDTFAQLMRDLGPPYSVMTSEQIAQEFNTINNNKPKELDFSDVLDPLPILW